MCVHKRKGVAMHPRRKAGGDELRSYTSQQRGSTDGRFAQSASDAKNTRMTPAPRETSSTFLLPSEIREGATSVTIDGRGRIVMVTYRR